MSDRQRPVVADRYELADAIGRGGMADVWSARDSISGQMVAVKVMRVGEAADPERFAAEMRILGRLSHPAIVRLFDTGTTADESPYFVMQLVEGESLSARLREEGPLPEPDLLKVARRVAGALAHAHERGVVHRDIKPANILIDGTGRGFLTDFGVARLVDATMVTRTGTTIGTAAYLAPEQLQDSAVGPAADVYALGLVLIEAFTGRRAFRGTGVEAAMARLGRDPDIPEDLPDNWRSLLLTMTRRDPDRRPSAEVVEQVLRGRQPPPPLDHDELAARTAPPAPGDDDPTALTPRPDPGWDPPASGSGPSPAAPADPPRTPPTPPPTPPPTSPPTPPQSSPGQLDAPPPPTSGRAGRPSGLDAIRSRALLVGAVLGAVVVLLAVSLALALGPEDDPVDGTEPVHEATRELLAVLEASERLRASDPSLAVELRALADDVVTAVNEQEWDAALAGIAAMGTATREGIDAADIESVAVSGVLQALRELADQVELEVEEEAGEETSRRAGGAGVAAVPRAQPLLVSSPPSPPGRG